MINNNIASIMIIICHILHFYCTTVVLHEYMYKCNNCVIVHLLSSYFLAVMILLSPPPSLSLSLSLFRLWTLSLLAGWISMVRVMESTSYSREISWILNSTR